MISQNSKNGLRNPWLLGVIALIIIVLGVNGTFIWFATHHRSTLVDKDYDTKDRKTNASLINDLQEQKALSWKTTINQPKHIALNQPTTYMVGVVDAAGAPVSGTLEVQAYRAADESRDFSTLFTETSPGNYQGAIAYPLKGFWELRIRIKRGADIFLVNTNKFTVETPV